ncbi:MAG: hypothetical protein ACLGH0_08610 [Thermoanaerobaculia bacterium]
MKHYSEADLLETYYMRPGESLPVMLHLADCADCAAKYERLERKLRGLAACAHHAEKPETFWSRQRISVMRRIDGERSTSIRRFAAAAVLALILGGSVAAPLLRDAPAPAPADTAVIPADPWESDALQEYRPIVEWESWGHS